MGNKLMQSLAFRNRSNQNGTHIPSMEEVEKLSTTVQVNQFEHPLSSRDDPETYPDGSPHNPPTIGPVDTETVINGVGETVSGPTSRTYLSDEAVGFVGILMVPIVTILYLTVVVKLLTLLAGSFVFLRTVIGL